MQPVEEEGKGAFEEDDELDDSEGDDSDMEDDLDDDEEEFPDLSPPQHSQPSSLPKDEPDSPITFLNPNPNHAVTPTRTAPQNGSIKAVPISVSDIPPAHIVSAAEDSRRVVSATSVDDSRRLFQRLWTDEDEITILQGFLEFTTQRGTTHASHQYDTGPFYEQIKKQLQLEFNKNQLIEKLRRLKKKYRNVVNRMVSGKDFVFKSAHEQATFEIARKIWSASVKRGRDSEDDEFTPNPASSILEFDSGFGVGAAAGDGFLSSERKLSRSSRKRIRMTNSEQEAAVAAAAAAANGVAVEVPIAAPLDPTSSVPIPIIIEETVKSCLSPLFKELLQSAMAGPQGGLIPGVGGIGGGGLLGMNPLQLGIGNLQGNLLVDEKWRNQNILELEVYLKRIELMRDQIKSTLEELKSSTPSAGD
ncbi:probable transcription factor At3g04930 [Phalaenopsis equestris]|uniref:probable transcription factor At3g04930 n=1 Tax=Phalaenopsis equestris TaxID=78828 RepID=UPI0009E436F6|nr:probable transcription factor At3g04930 [Phalaenopsis equestris]XP_020597487.1 probable transcription factor At3g04930 [Phalaenopsis equestris]XP_020597488.1 probable transcription factor At3g04930 [Phalaenopsis equestris]XP_020597490.1 probable transcription factor At3g04930 [Phalaenopsis equestris]